jgi:hypothetical protein
LLAGKKKPRRPGEKIVLFGLSAAVDKSRKSMRIFCPRGKKPGFAGFRSAPFFAPRRKERFAPLQSLAPHGLFGFWNKLNKLRKSVRAKVYKILTC